MFHYISITIAPNYHRAHYYIDGRDDESILDIELTYKEGMDILRRLEKMSGKLANLEVNQFDPSICSKALYFFE